MIFAKNYIPVFAYCATASHAAADFLTAGSLWNARDDWLGNHHVVDQQVANQQVATQQVATQQVQQRAGLIAYVRDLLSQAEENGRQGRAYVTSARLAEEGEESSFPVPVARPAGYVAHARPVVYEEPEDECVIL